MQDAYNRIWWWYRFEWDGSLYWTRRKGPPLPWRTDPLVGSILLIQEVDYDNIMLLTVPVAAPDALLDALRVPREVVVDDQRAELKIDPLGSNPSLSASQSGLQRNSPNIASKNARNCGHS